MKMLPAVEGFAIAQNWETEFTRDGATRVILAVKVVETADYNERLPTLHAAIAQHLTANAEIAAVRLIKTP